MNEQNHPAIGQTRTCDSCAEMGTIVFVDPDSEAYVCSKCNDKHLEALKAAAVVLATSVGHTLASVVPPEPAPNTLHITAEILNRYFEVLNGWS